MLNMGNVEAVVKCLVRFLERLIGVSFAQDIMVGDVGALLRIENRSYLVRMQIRMDQRRVRFHAFQRIKYCRKLFILDFDQFAGFLGKFFGLRSDCRDRLTFELRSSDCQEVFIFQIQTGTFLIVITGNNAAYAFQLFRFARIDLQDLCVCVGAALHLRIQRTGELNIIRELRSSGYFFNGIKPFYGRSDNSHLS